MAADGVVEPSLTALLADPRMALRRCPPHITLGQLRTAANAFQASMPRPPIAAVEDLVAHGLSGPIPLRLYRPHRAAALPVIVFTHGGGFLFGNLDTHDAMCRTLANLSGAAVLAVAYRLAPEYHFPAPLDDVGAVLEWLTIAGCEHGVDPRRLALAGDSAGAQLAAAMAVQWASALPTPRHVGLLYPILDPSCRSVSMRQFGEGHMLTRDFIDWAWEAYRGPAAPDNDPRFDLSRADLARFPATTIVTAQFDPLRDEGEAFGERLAGLGIDTEVHRFAGMIHGFAGLPPTQAQSEAAITLIARRIGAALRA